MCIKLILAAASLGGVQMALLEQDSRESPEDYPLEFQAAMLKVVLPVDYRVEFLDHLVIKTAPSFDHSSRVWIRLKHYSTI
jgi:hypothetical protein